MPQASQGRRNSVLFVVCPLGPAPRHSQSRGAIKILELLNKSSDELQRDIRDTNLLLPWARSFNWSSQQINKVLGNQNSRHKIHFRESKWGGSCPWGKNYFWFNIFMIIPMQRAAFGGLKLWCEISLITLGLRLLVGVQPLDEPDNPQQRGPGPGMQEVSSLSPLNI